MFLNNTSNMLLKTNAYCLVFVLQLDRKYYF